MSTSRKLLTAFLVVGILCLVAIVGFSLLYPATWQQLKTSRNYATRSMGVISESSMGYAGGNLAGMPAQPPLAMMDRDEKMMAPQPQPQDGGALEVSPQDRLIVKTGTVSLQAADVRWAAGAITSYATKNSGIVVNNSLEKQGNELYGSVTIRVPAANFEAAMSEMKNFGVVVSENTTGQDVTRAFVDLNARLKNLQASETQLLELMKRSGNVSDVLNVQRELTSVRSEIEAMQAQVKYLQQSSSFSTITVYLSTDKAALPVAPSAAERWQPKVIIKEAIRNLIAAGKVLVNGFIWVAVFTPVWAPIILVIWLLYRWINKRMSR